MTTLVTGASGFIGSRLTELLLDEGVEVRVLARNPSALPPSLKGRAGTARADLSTGEGLKEAVGGVATVIHLAGTTHALRGSEYMRVNARGTALLLAALRNSCAGLSRFVLVSSQAAAGPGCGTVPVTEGDEPCPCTPYGRSKLKAERLVGKAGIPFTIVRPPIVYGPGDKATLGFFRLAKIGILPVTHGRDRWYSLIHVDDLVRGIADASRSARASAGTYFLSCGEPVTWNRMMEGIRAAVGAGRVRRLNLSTSALRIAAAAGESMQGLLGLNLRINKSRLGEFLPACWICSPAKAARDFGFECRIGLEEGLRETARWYREKGWL